MVQAVAEGGIITFNCGKNPVTILMTATANVANTEHSVVLDGGGLVTLSGGGQRRILFSDTCAGTWSTKDCVSQPYPQIVVQNITFEHGLNVTHQIACTANAPQCWYGGVNGGGAIYAEGGQFKAVNSSFVDNQCYRYGPDLGGGAIRVLAQYQSSPVYITSDTFTVDRCSNGGALVSVVVGGVGRCGWCRWLWMVSVVVRGVGGWWRVVVIGGRGGFGRGRGAVGGGGCPRG